MKRNRKSKLLRDTILIICGKTETEKNYFLAFKERIRVGTGKINIKILNKGATPLEVVQLAVSEKRAAEPDSPYRHIWAIFDKDEFEIQTAITLAASNDINIAWSNEAFELWFVYHFEYFTAPLSRNNYKEKIEKYLKRDYEKSDSSLYHRLEKRMNTAIENARKSYQWHLAQNHMPEKSCSCTTVYQLVELLKDWM